MTETLSRILKDEAMAVEIVGNKDQRLALVRLGSRGTVILTGVAVRAYLIDASGARLQSFSCGDGPDDDLRLDTRNLLEGMTTQRIDILVSNT